MLARLRQLYRAEQFRPTPWLGPLATPFYHARRGLYLHLRELAPHVTGRTLDVGCGRKPYEELFASTAYVGLEFDTPENRQHKHADAFYDGRTFPFADAAFDSCLATQVLEHVFEPEAFLREIHRVLRPGGTLLVTVPFVWGEHEQPYDYARYSSFGLKALCERCGFETVAQRQSGGTFAVLAQLLNCQLYRWTRSRHMWLNALATSVLMAPVSYLGCLLSWFFPGPGDIYLDNIIVLRRR